MQDKTLHVYNWGEYTGENIISGFEELTGAKVIMDNFDSNRQMYIRLPMAMRMMYWFQVII